MPTKRPQLVNGEIYHIVIKGVGGMEIFKNISDYYRGVFSLYEFNNFNLVTIQRRREIRNSFKNKIRRDRIPTDFVDDRNMMVEILVFCLMPNHVHLLVKQIKDGGISQFMQKLGVGYAGYFNIKYKREGHLFQGRYKIIHVKTDEQLRNVFAYIHTNPISLIEPGWKEKGIKNSQKVIEFLENYKWSSYQDYIGIKNFPSVTRREFLLETLGGDKGCMAVLKDWIEYKKGLKSFGDIVLE